MQLLMLTIVLTLSLTNRTFGYIRNNLTCYDCTTVYTGDACHVVTRLTPRTTVYNDQKNQMLFCRFYTPYYHEAGGYPPIKRDIQKHRYFPHYDNYNALCLCSNGTIPVKCRNCAVCQRDLCNTGFHTFKNHDVDGFTGNGSLETTGVTRYDQPVIGTLINLYQDYVLKIPRNIYRWFKPVLKQRMTVPKERRFTYT
uniref:Sodefrin-like factor n=1 Tax=Cacopsylla melanoneura TaxID=428564 RepID=A0A8D9BDA6_9HEMI